MASSSVDQNRNATSSWSGYIHQGKVGFLVALRQLRQCIETGVSYEEYSIRYENAEDFDIIDNNGQVLSRHQVKAYTNGNEREAYSDLFNIQTRKFEDGKEKIDTKGFQIHEFDGSGKAVREVVRSDCRFLHVIVDVPDFKLSNAVQDIIGADLGGIGMGFGEHYQPAFDFYEKIRGQYGDNITLTGHSLGGNVAQRVALEYNVDNTVVYNSAPLYVNQTYGIKERLYDWVTPGESNVERIDQQRETFTGQVTRLQDEQDFKRMVLVIPSITVVIMLK